MGAAIYQYLCVCVYIYSMHMIMIIDFYTYLSRHTRTLYKRLNTIITVCTVCVCLYIDSVSVSCSRLGPRLSVC